MLLSRYWTRPDRNRMHELEYYEWERRENYSEPQQLGMFPQGVSLFTISILCETITLFLNCITCLV